MSTRVFINGREACSRAADGKSIAAFPDACWSPPSPPAGPVVIPYTNTAQAKDLKNGTTTVFIQGSPVAVEDKSYFSTSMGDEPATQAFPQGVVSHTIKGRAYFVSWSMNVKFEGRGVCRHGDLMTHNHGSMGANTPPHPYLDSSDTGTFDAHPDCKENKETIENKCPGKNGENWESECPQTDFKYQKDTLFHAAGSAARKPQTSVEANSYTDAVNESDCLKARKCDLKPYNSQDKNCCPGQTGHHLLPDAMFRKIDAERLIGNTGNPIMSRDGKPTIEGWSKYTEGDGLVICLEGISNSDDCGSHGKMHSRTKDVLRRFQDTSSMKFSDARDEMTKVLSESSYNCSEDCIKAQINDAYGRMCDDPKKLGETKVVPHSGQSGDTNLLKSIKERIPDGFAD